MAAGQTATASSGAIVAPSCPSCGAPLELQEVTEANRFGDRRRAAVASCTGCEFITEIDWRIVAAANLAAGGGK